MMQNGVKLDENKGIHRVFMRKQRKTRAFHQIYRVFNTVCENTQRNPSFSVKFLVSFGEIGENTRNSWKTVANIYIYIEYNVGKVANSSQLTYIFSILQEEFQMRIIMDTTKGRIVLPKNFFVELDKMNKTFADAGIDKKWTAEEYVKDQFAKMIKETMLRPEDKVVK